MNKIKLGNKFFYYQVFYKNNKNMYLRIKNDLIVITCNRHMTNKRIEEFILKNEDNIIKKTEIENNKVPLYNQEYMMIFNKKYRLRYNVNSKKNSYLITDDSVNISFKSNYFDTFYIEKIYKDLTLLKMDYYFKEIYNLISKHINIDNIVFKAQLMKSRFGSCIPKKRIIKLNSILSRFDEEYIKIILIHELIHIDIKNHQKDFYNYINMFIPNYKKQVNNLNKLTRKYVI